MTKRQTLISPPALSQIQLHFLKLAWTQANMSVFLNNQGLRKPADYLNYRQLPLLGCRAFGSLFLLFPRVLFPNQHSAFSRLQV